MSLIVSKEQGTPLFILEERTNLAISYDILCITNFSLVIIVNTDFWLQESDNHDTIISLCC